MDDTRTAVTFYAFDILMHAGEDMRELPFRDRISVLDSAFIPNGYALLCDNFPGPGTEIAAAVRKLGGGGVIAKRLDRSYEAGKRSGS